MKITIAERLHPFSHEAGTQFLLPHSSLCVQIFPTRLCFSDLEGKLESFFIAFDFKGPLSEFTAELDLEHGTLKVFGQTRLGYMRYLICAKDDGVWLTMERIPEDQLFCRRSFPPEQMTLAKGESMLICLPLKRQSKGTGEERLSLGIHKSQDWDQLRRRLDLKEIFPHWLKLAALVPPRGDLVRETAGNFSLLAICRQKIQQGDKETVCEAFENLFRAAFAGVLVPRVMDSDYQGIVEEGKNPCDPISPLPLLTEAARCIRSLFFQESDGEISLLPCLPSPFHCGRMVGIRTLNDQVIHFEWTKKCLRSVVIESGPAGEVALALPKGIRSFRMTSGRRMMKKILIDAQRKTVLSLEEGKTVCLDRFEH
ncbi:MAG: hypothetical protein JSS60_02485 [Verrucomicrobia bacterium]|nr:hypothetical protein [Verrucomicrobiota bacterium]